MELINLNTDTLTLSSGVYEIKIEEDKDLTVKITDKVTLFVNVLKAKSVKLNYELATSANLELFLVNEAEATIAEEYQLANDANISAAYGDLNNGLNKHVIKYDLNGSGARVESKLAYICKSEDQKNLEVKVEHLAKDTYSNVEVYGVCRDESRLNGDVIGHIINGASGSECHQASRVLNFDANVHAKVEPILLIDENDVQASHACSMGTVDEDQLYYLCSRGLTPNEAVGLIVNGYLAVLSSVSENEELKEKINSILEEKAGA